jgi:hypothetical protein
MQMMIYLSTFVHEDGWQLVATVCFLWYAIYYFEPKPDVFGVLLRLLETAHVFFIGNYLYYNLLVNYCNPQSATTKVEDVSQHNFVSGSQFYLFSSIPTRSQLPL